MKMNKACLIGASFVALIAIAGCSDSSNPVEPPSPPPPPEQGSIPSVIDPDVSVVRRGTKISQLIGDYDQARGEPTQNQTATRYRLRSTDLGVPFQYEDRTYLLFGDTHGNVGGNRDAIAYTTDTQPEDGISLNFIHDDAGVYKPVSIPGLSQGAFEVPMEGVSVDDKMYVYHTTGYNPPTTMGSSVVARSDDGGKTFSYLYRFSNQHFINTSIVKAPSSNWEMLPGDGGTGLIMVGSGEYRESDVYLAYQPASEIENPDAIRYFAGVDDQEEPLWSESEGNAVPLFEQSCVGELSLSYNKFIDRWILLYNCGDPRGINMRTAESPWGPWTKPQVVFEPWKDDGYCNFIHVSWESQHCDDVYDVGRKNVWGGEYGPYQFGQRATGNSQSTTIYFTMSTWNPYTVVLMKAGLKLQEEASQHFVSSE